MKFAEAKSLYTLVLSTLFVAHNVIVLSEFLFFFFFSFGKTILYTLLKVRLVPTFCLGPTKIANTKNISVYNTRHAKHAAMW